MTVDVERTTRAERRQADSFLDVGAIDDAEGETSCVPDFSGATECERYSAQQDGHRISIFLWPSPVDTHVSRHPFEINV